MDLITQTQNYVSAIATLMAHSIEHLQLNSAPLPLPSGVPITAAAGGGGGAAVTSSAVSGSSSSSSSASAAPSPAADLTASDETIEEKADTIFRRFVEGNVLPTHALGAICVCVCVCVCVCNHCSPFSCCPPPAVFVGVVVEQPIC